MRFLQLQIIGIFLYALCCTSQIAAGKSDLQKIQALHLIEHSFAGSSIESIEVKQIKPESHFRSPRGMIAQGGRLQQSASSSDILGLSQQLFIPCGEGYCLANEICSNGLCHQASQWESPLGKRGPLDGTFLQAGHLSYEMLAEFFEEVNDLAMDIIILQNTRTKGTSCVAAECCNMEDYDWLPGFPEKLGEILRLADEKQFKVYVGLDLTAHGICPLSYYLEPNAGLTIEDTRKTAKLLEQSYGSYGSFSGWYLPDEPALGEWLYPGLADRYYAGLVRAIREHSSRPILVSPHFVGVDWRSPETMARRAKAFLENTGVDVLVWQDAVGAEGVNLEWNPHQNSSADFLSAIADEVGPSATWSLHEAFNCCVNDAGADENGAAYRPTSIVRFANQIDQGKKGNVGKRVAWIQQHHFSGVDPYRLPEAERLLDGYLAHYDFAGQLLHPLTYDLMTEPDELYPDSGGELFNFRTGDPKDFTHQEWVGLDASEEGLVSLIIDLGSESSIDWVGIHLLNMPAVGIQFPYEMDLACSTDGDSWLDLGNWKLPFDDLMSGAEYVFANDSPLSADCVLIQVSLRANNWVFASEVEIISKAMSRHAPFHPLLIGMLQAWLYPH